MSKNELSTFTFKSTVTLSGVPTTRMANIRVVTINGEPWFVAADVCRALGLEMDRKGVHKHLTGLDANQRQVVARQDAPEIFVGFDNRVSSLTLISEGGLYDKVLSAHKVNPAAKPFQDWVTKVVLPAIRKDGAYIMGEEKVVTGELSEDTSTSGVR